MNKFFILCAASLALAGCSKSEPTPVESTATEKAIAEMPAPAMTDDVKISEILASMPAEAIARYEYRHPAETLQFFGIAPGMTVVEALPGGGWYSKILIPFLGSDGKLIGVDYELEMFPLFGVFSDEAMEKKKTWAADWVTGAEEWRGDNAATVEAFVFGAMPEQYAGQADAVLMIRALHNLNRFEDEGSFRTRALADAFKSLKPGGVLGVVQHKAAEDMPDDWADGSNGYLKQSTLITDIENAGFVFVDASNVNLNPADQPTAEDFVWRLPPTLATSRDNEELRAELTAIGETTRMTLRFKKPE